jgi:isopenicillin-N N-acyltransferase like protein
MRKSSAMSNPKEIHFRMQLLLFVLLLLLEPSAFACTSWTAAGSRVTGGGTIIAKNRDYAPEKAQVKMVAPSKGFKYLGLFPDRAPSHAVAGTNEKGLTVVTLTAGTVPKSERHAAGKWLIREILADYDSVDGVLQNMRMFSSSLPTFYVLADSVKTAVVEVAPGGKYSVDQTSDGNLYHTNHYLDAALSWANKRLPAESSIKRLARIRELAARHQTSLTRDDFIAFSRDQHDTPNNSIWRTDNNTQTLATWIVHTAQRDSPMLFVRTANPGESEKCLSVKLEPSFWKVGEVRLGQCPQFTGSD